MRRQLGRRGDILGIGIERIDYTKGIPERFEALDRFFERYPEFRERLTFVQVGVPTRGHIASYQQIDKEIDRLVEQLNWKWGTPRWRPVVYFKRHFSPVEMTALASSGRLLHRQLASRRNEPGCQGVCREPAR